SSQGDTTVEDDVASARALFDSYVTLSNSYDPGLADLYAMSASITVYRADTDGTLHSFSFNGADAKRLMPALMNYAQQAGDSDDFSNVSFQTQGPGQVRITATRTSSRGFSVPHEMVVKRFKDGSWLIVEEVGLTPST